MFYFAFKVVFAGELALDQVGPIREFLTLFFDRSRCISNGTVTALSAQLKSEEYVCLGRLMALAAVHGHPGHGASCHRSLGW